MIVTRVLPAGIDLLALHRSAPQRYPLLLESVADGTAQARWDLLLAGDGDGLRLNGHGVTRCGDGGAVPGGFLAALDAAWRGARLPREEPRWPFRGGWALLLAYELAAEVEP
ncbi:MAG: aminodeoxychorismate synthase, component I, partial [Pseudomonadota bacterium]|nr:aminodeoxychorismate synthase, component I [Pseudomonadota bacterium]